MVWVVRRLHCGVVCCIGVNRLVVREGFVMVWVVRRLHCEVFVVSRSGVNMGFKAKEKLAGVK